MAFEEQISVVGRGLEPGSNVFDFERNNDGERLQNLRAKMAASGRVIRDSVISVVTVGWTDDDVTEITSSRRQLRWRKVVHFLLIQITKIYSNISPCC